MNHSPTSSKPSLLLFDPYATGHHAEHIRHLVRSWAANKYPLTLLVAVSPKLGSQLSDTFASTSNETPETLQTIRIDEAGKLTDTHRLSLGKLSRINTALFKDVIETHRPTYAHALYLDHLQLGLATTLTFPFPVKLSGLLFRPEFHYSGQGFARQTFNQKLRRIRKKILLKAAFANQHINAAFTLDPYAPAAINKLVGREIAFHQPEPVEVSEVKQDPASVRKSFAVEPHRRMLLLFGLLNKRKGVHALLQALHHIDKDSAKRIAIVLAGKVSNEDRKEITGLIRRCETTSCQVILKDWFIPDNLIQSLIASADLSIIPYQNHIGSSGVLVRSIHANTPVLGQNYGVIGRQIREFGLGQTVDTTSPKEIAKGIQHFLNDETMGFDAARAASFAQQNTVKAYTDTFFQHILSL